MEQKVIINVTHAHAHTRTNFNHCNKIYLLETSNIIYIGCNYDVSESGTISSTWVNYTNINYVCQQFLLTTEYKNMTIVVSLSTLLLTGGK